MDDGEAVNLLRRGDRRGPEALLQAHEMSVYNLSLRMLKNPADAEDATQEIFVRAFTRIHQFRPEESFGAWIQGVTRHYCIDQLRIAGRATAPLLELIPASHDVEREALDHIDSTVLRAAVDRLPARDRALLVLRYWEDQPVEAIARNLRISDGAARLALLRARRALRSLLSSKEVESHAV